eukprot:COSAG01_NODE_7347_length_3242_cov_3.487432_3_plen_456_part_01
MQLFLDLHHPHVVACYGILKERVESEDGASSPRMKNSIVTERCRKPLDHFLAEHSEWMGLGGDEIDLRKYTILHHVSLGLQKLHDMGVLHRDIKGGNLLLDGVPKTCDTCQHAGKWKICDFGEAKVLKRPSLQFSDAQPWPKGWSGSLSFQPITSPFLRDQGARHYCWLPSGQVLEPATNHDPPPTPKNCGRNHAITNRWTPCPHSGGFVYSFSEDPSHHDARDCFFSLSGVTGDTTSANLVPFPKSLGPFGLSPTELLPVVDFESLTYQLRSTLYQNPQLQLLKTMLPEGGTIEGKISPPCRITLSDSERRQALIPPGATHFAWAYQAVDLETLSAEQNKQLEKALPKALTGWGAWTGKGVKPSKRPSPFMKDLESKPKALIASRKKRADDGLRHVLINEKKNKKAAVFEASSVPFGFGNRSLYEASIRQPVGRDWNTAATTKRQTQQEVVTRLG